MKTFMKNWRPNRMKQFWLHSLLRTYSWVMIVIIASFALLISYVNWDSREKEARQVSQRVLTRTVSEVEYYYRESARSAQSLVDNQARIEGIYKYFSLSTPDYFYWQLERKASPYISVSIYENIDDLYVRNDFVTGVAIVLQDSTEVYVSTREIVVVTRFLQTPLSQMLIVLLFPYPIQYRIKLSELFMFLYLPMFFIRLLTIPEEIFQLL